MYDCSFSELSPQSTLKFLMANELLMDMLEQNGLSTFVGKVNMFRNAPDYLVE